MQVVILCGGFGTRIRDVADDVPKPMIPIGDRPILWHIMHRYAQFGFTDFVLCLGHKSWQIKRWFLDYRLAQADCTIRLTNPGMVEFHGADASEDWRITFAETGTETMTGGRIKRVEKYIHDDAFMVTYGDGVANIDLHELVAFHRSHGRIGTVTTVRPPGRFGELDLDDDCVLEFSEKPLVAPGWVSGGFFVFQREFFARLDDDPALILERDPLRELARDRELMAYRHRGFWHPMDNSRDYQLLNEMHAEGNTPWLDDRPGENRLVSARVALTAR